MDFLEIKSENSREDQSSESECTSPFDGTASVITIDGIPDFKTKITNGEIQLREKRGRSRAWKVFAIMIDENGDEIENFVACRHCFNAYKFANSTSNLVKHKCFVKFEERENSMRNPQYAQMSSEAKAKLNDAAVQWLVKNCRSCNILDDSGLKDFASILISIGADFGENINLDDAIPKSSTIAKSITELYEEQCQTITAELCHAKGNGYSITIALWMDNFLKQSIASISVHYFYRSAMVSRFLAAYPLAWDSNKGNQIRACVEKSLRSFDCDLDVDKPIIVTKGNQVEEEAIANVFKNQNHIRCIISILENAIEEVFRENFELHQLLQKCISLVTQCELLRESDCLVSASNSISARKYTIMYCFEYVADNWTVLSETIVDKCEEEIIIIEIKDISHILVNFAQMFQALKKHNVPTLHTVIPHLHKLNKLCASNAEDKPKVDLLKSSLRKYLQSISKNHITKYHKIALFLFPPAKKLLLYNESEKRDIIAECKAMMEEFYIEPDNNSRKKIKLDAECYDSSIFSDFVEATSNDSKAYVISNEMNEYLSRNIALCNVFNVIDWWQRNKGVFPLLYQVSCKILTTPATIGFSKRSILQARNLFSDQSSTTQCSEGTINEIIFLNNNFDCIS